MDPITPQEALPPFTRRMGALLLFAGIFFTNFLARIILAPFLIIVERDLHLGHAEAGSLFTLISAGVCIALLGSGFVSSRLTHRRTIALSSLLLGVTLIATSLVHTMTAFAVCLFFIGLAAGLYFPSAIASILGLVHPQDWGKAISIHELAPNLGFVTAPVLAELLSRFISWRETLFILGLLSFVALFIFVKRGQGGEFHGVAPHPRVVRALVSRPSFWIMVTLFGFSVGASLGVYTLLPLYLVSERGMDRAFANTLVALSRIPGIGMALLAGWLADRIGLRRAIGIFVSATGIATALLGLASQAWVGGTVFLQAVLSVCFFPPGFAALSHIVPAHLRSTVVAFGVPFGVLVGAGGVPALLGLLAEKGSFSLGFLVAGGCMATGAALLPFLKFADEGEPAGSREDAGDHSATPLDPNR